MQVSYGETSGFVPVLNDELQAVNGGSPAVAIVVTVPLTGCAAPVVAAVAITAFVVGAIVAIPKTGK
jgi:hypothetical protein